jgi:RNA polymerase sigma factor for flagellar operon FliA
VKRYDPKRGVGFESFAQFRIKGAILDELRAYDLLPRPLRKKVKALEDAYLRLEKELGRVPSLEELASELGLSLEALEEEFRRFFFLKVVSFDGLLEDFSREKLEEMLMDSSSKDPLELLGLSELRDHLAEAIEELPERHKLVLSLYYFEELTMKEIALVLGISEGRVSQIHSEAILALRAKLRRSYEESP